MNLMQKITGTGILFLLLAGSGIWLSGLGKPYNSLLFNVHKLIALGTVLFTVFMARNVMKGMDAKGILILFIIITGLSFLVLFVTGAMLSIGKLPYQLMKATHEVSAILSIISTGIAVILLLLRKK